MAALRVRRKLRSRFALVTLASLALIAGSLASSIPRPPSVSADDSHNHHPSGFVYVNDNTTGTNTVAGFARAADGLLTPLSGSPFSVGGAGTGAAVPSQGGAQVTQDGRFLLVADAGSNQVSVLRVQNDGSLQSVPSSPFSSDGRQPVSIAVQGATVFVANTGTPSTASTDCDYKTGGGSNYTGFRLDDGGRLTPLPNSTVCVPPASGLGDVVLNADATHLSGSRVNPSTIDSSDVDEQGALTVSPGSPFPAQGLGPFGSAFSPSHLNQLFVSNAHNGGTDGTVSVFDVSRNAVLTAIPGSPFADQQVAPCWVTISSDGRYLFASNTGNGSISTYVIANDGSLSLLGSANVKGGGGNTDVALDRDADTLYVLHGSAVNVLNVKNGALTKLPGSAVSLPAGATPFGIAVS